MNATIFKVHEYLCRRARVR